MVTKQLEQADWHAYFDRVTRTLVHEKAPIYTEVRIMNPEMGAQTETEWTPLVGITYDPREKSLEIAMDPIDHMIPAPSEIVVVEGTEGLPTVIEVISGDTKQVIELRY